MAALRLLAAALLVSVAAAASAQVLTFTEDTNGPNLVPLGYPIPLPIASQIAIDGFRRYDSLQARLSALALASHAIREVEIGRSVAGRPIHAYVLGDADTVTAEGFAESAALFNGGIHAREWASPEVGAALIERFAARQNDAGLHRYLLDTVNLIVVPVLNVDGFLQTQRHPTQALQTEYARDPQPAQMTQFPPEYRNVPRDGRFRRKNMRGVDELLCAASDPSCAIADGMSGIDLNRNHEPFFASGNQNTAEVGSLLHRGSASGSEPESQALYAAAGLAPESRLRLFVDIHSFSRLLYGVDTGNTRRDALTRQLATTLRLAARAGSGRDYPYEPTPPGFGIGSTDEYFGYRLQIPAYTLEIEPDIASGATEYGSFGYHHDGFVLPANQIARVREELTEANIAALYRMAGPPALLAAALHELPSGVRAFSAQRTRNGQGRVLAIERPQALRADTDYRLWLAFDKPMRVRNAGGGIAQLDGQSVALAPALVLEGTDATGQTFSESLGATSDGWRSVAGAAPEGRLRYADDAYALDFRLSARAAGARALLLRVQVPDAVGQALDANAATVADWNAGWSGYEDDAGRSDTDTGGADRSLVLIAASTPAPEEPGGGGGGSPGPAVLALMALGLLLRTLRGRLATDDPKRRTP